MYRYGKVLFKVGGEKGAMLQNILITRLNAQGVITVPNATIQRWYESDRTETTGCSHTYVLHNKQEVDIFRTIMESKELQDESIKWKICRFEHNREFRKWAEESNIVSDPDQIFKPRNKKEKNDGEREKV